MKLAVLADGHVSSSDEGKRGEDYAQPQGLRLLERAVAAVEAAGVDRVIVAGDLVNMGYDAEYADATRVLAPVAHRLDVIPGNHELVHGDLPTFERHFGATPRTLDLGGVPAVLLNTAQTSMDARLWFGEMHDSSREALLAACGRPGPLVVVMHHPFAGTVRTAPYPMMTQTNDADLRRAVETRPGPTLVLSGHAHRGDLRRVGTATYLGLPPVCYWPHAFVTLDIGSGAAAVETHYLVDDVADSPDAKTRDGERHLDAAGYRRDCAVPVPSFRLNW